MTKTEKKVLKKAVTYWLIAALGISIFCLFNWCNRKNNGIIALEDYPHGVVICGEGMTINDGHYKDVEVKRLIDLAEKECPK